MQHRRTLLLTVCTTVALIAAVVCVWQLLRPSALRSLTHQRRQLPVANDAKIATLSGYTWGASLQGLARTRSGSSPVDPQQYRHEWSLALDANADGERERYTLQDGQVQEMVQGNVAWRTPSTWWVDDVAIADADRDGAPDLVLSLWKAGDYGPSKPFWVSENDMAVRNHLFVYALSSGQPKATWQSSNLDKPNCDFRFGDLDADGKDELVVLEGWYTADWSCRADHLAVWRWHDWGFVNDWRSAAGDFGSLEVKDGTVYVASD